MAFIILLQGIWIANVYQLMQKQLYATVNELLNVSLNKELAIRIKIIQEKNIESQQTEIISESDFEVGELISSELSFQDYLIKEKRFISLQKIDSVFHSETAKQNIHGKFIINRINPQTGEILETTDSLRKGKLQGALVSEVIPTRIDGSEGVQVLLLSPYRTIFLKMMYILALSVLLVLFVGYAIFFLLRSFIHEKKLRQFQTDFSHALTHDMASPLQTIAQVNAMMKNEKFVANADKRLKYIDIAQQQIVNLQALIDRILTLARFEQSRLVPEIGNVEITSIVRQLVEKFSVQTKKDVHFTTQFMPETVIFRADATMLYNAVSNLIDNSIKYSGESVKIDIDCHVKKNGLHIGVEDNGYGISEKNKAVIFAKFERGDAVTRKEAKGFGLGLAYVKSVAEVHGGTVNLFSKEGKGCNFELFIPFEKEHKAVDTEKETPKSDAI